MKHLTTLLTIAITLTGMAQQMPYNPDENNDAFIGSADLTGFLSNYGNSFYPSEILIEEQPLSAVLAGLQAALDSLSQSSTNASGSVLDMPVGTILPVASANVPDGWMLCDGSEVSIEDYPELYASVGTTYGAGDSAFWAQVFFPATTFNIPDLRGRTIIGADNMGGEAANRVSLEPYPILGVGAGEDTHVISMEELPDLSFYIPGGQYVTSSPSNPGTGVQSGAAAGGITIDLGGVSAPFSMMQPYLALNYMIKAKISDDVVANLQAELDSLSSVQVAYDSQVVGFGLSSGSLANGESYEGSQVVATVSVPGNSIVEIEGQFTVSRGQYTSYSTGSVSVLDNDGNIVDFSTIGPSGGSTSSFSMTISTNCNIAESQSGTFIMKAFFEESQELSITASNNGYNSCSANPVSGSGFSGNMIVSITTH